MAVAVPAQSDEQEHVPPISSLNIQEENMRREPRVGATREHVRLCVLKAYSHYICSRENHRQPPSPLNPPST